MVKVRQSIVIPCIKVAMIIALYTIRLLCSFLPSLLCGCSCFPGWGGGGEGGAEGRRQLEFMHDWLLPRIHSKLQQNRCTRLLDWFIHRRIHLLIDLFTYLLPFFFFRLFTKLRYLISSKHEYVELFSHSCVCVFSGVYIDAIYKRLR